MGKVCLVLSMQDYNTIAEALLESALDWEHAADEMGCLHQFCARTGDPAYGAKLDRLDPSSAAIGASPGAGGPCWNACKDRRRQHHADGALETAGPAAAGRAGPV